MPPARLRHVLSISTRQFRTPDVPLTRAISPVTAPGKDRLGRTIGPTEESQRESASSTRLAALADGAGPRPKGTAPKLRREGWQATVDATHDVAQPSPGLVG